MSIEPLVIEKYKGTIWRIEIDELSETLFVEVRASEERKVSFSSVNLKNGNVYFKDVIPPMPWATGIETAYNGILFLHNYQSESSPTHRGLTAINGLTGRTLWNNFNYTFDHLSAKGPVVYDSRVQPRKLFLIDYEKGSFATVFATLDYELLKNQVNLPDSVIAGSLPSEFLPQQPFGDMVDYKEFNNFKILSLHALKDGSISQFLYVFYDNNKLYEDLLAESMQKMQPESFMMYKNHLIYIKNKTELKVLSL